MHRIARNILSGALAVVSLFLVQALPAGASDGTADLCATHNPDESIQCSSPNHWCGNTCQAQPTPTATQDINCSSCTTICASATPCSYPTCTAATSTSGVTSCTGDGSCPANGGVFVDQCSSVTGCPAGKTLCSSPRSCATTPPGGCSAGFIFNPCANGGLGACESPYVVLSPDPSVRPQTGDIYVNGDFNLGDAKNFYVNGGAATSLRFRNTGAGGTLNIGIGQPSPTAQLDMLEAGSSGWLVMRLNQNNATKLYTGLRLDRTGNEKWFVGMNNTDDMLRFRTAGIFDAVVVDTTGNVGIGVNPNSRFDIGGELNIRGGVLPAVSPLDQGRIYFDSTLDKFRVSQNGGAYTDLISTLSGSGAAGQAAFWTGAGTLSSDANFVWDNTNKWLGIGIAPNNRLRVANLVNFDSVTGSTFLGVGAGGTYGATDLTNTVVGYFAGDAFNNTGGTQNVLVGYRAGTALTSGDWNVAIGANALAAATTAYRNIAIGAGALASHVAGGNNAAIGESALGACTGCNRAVAIGDWALSAALTAADNTGVGEEALRFFTSASNTAVGTMALRGTSGVSTGANNTAVGYQAGFTNALNPITTGSNNTFLGYSSGASSSSVSNAAAIGANAIVGASNAMVLGSGVRVGIGESSPGFKLHVLDNAGAGTAIINITQNNATKLFTGFRMARQPAAAPDAEKWFIGMNATDDKLRLRRTSSADAVIIEDATGHVNVNGGGLSTNAGDATMLANTVETGKMCLGDASTGSENFCRTSWPPVLGSFVGLSAGSTGSAGGYVGANAVCNTAFAGSHVCDVTEMMNTINTVVAAYFGVTNGTDMWINGGPPGYTAPANDCVGWTDAGATKYGRKWRKDANGGQGTLTFCDQSIQFACCR